MTAGRQFLSITLVAVLGASLAYSLFAVGNTADLAELPRKAEDITPLRTGDKAPAFTVLTVDGKPFHFEPDALDEPTLLISFRGGWCPYCNTHLSELRTVVPALRDMGYRILFISNDRPDQLYAGLSRETQDAIADLDYTILSDAELLAARAMGTAFKTAQSLEDYLDRKGRDYEDSSIDKFKALGVPFVYVVDRQGMIVFDFVEPDYKVRLAADDLYAAAREAVR